MVPDSTRAPLLSSPGPAFVEASPDARPSVRFAAGIVCRCLQVSESEIREAIETCAVETVQDLGRCTGAGQGCTACHRLLRRYIAQHQAETAGDVDSQLKVG